MTAPVDRLPELEALRDSHAVVYHGLIDHDAPRMLYEHLREVGHVPRLDLVLATNGGNPAAARRLALLLHGYTDRLTVLVAHRARSAGTLLCLGAHEIVLGPLAELGPLDPQIGSAGGKPGEPGVLSAEDVRAFQALARDWFGVERDEDRLQVLALLAQRVFPGTLGAFYRADRQIRDSAAELLAYQLPEADPAHRDAIVDRLVAGYHAHDHAITRDQARALGLRVSYPSPREEALLWAVVRGCTDQIAAENNGHRVVALLAGGEFRARRVEYPSGPDGRDVRWEMG